MIHQEESKPLHLFRIRRLVLFAIVFLLAFVTKVYEFQFIYGITYTLSTLFLLIILRLYGLKVGTVTTVLLHLILVAFFDRHYLDAVFVVEVVFLGIVLFYKRNGNMITWDLVFWVIVGMPLYFLYYTTVTGPLSGSVLYVQLLNHLLNGISNVLVADIILAYIPLYRWINGKDRRYQLYQLRQFIFHILIGIIIYPFMVNVSLSSLNSYYASLDSMEQISSNSATNIERELRQWRVEDLQRLQLMGVIQIGYLNEIIDRNIAEEMYEVIFINESQQVVASNSDKLGSKDHFEWQEENHVKVVGDQFFQILPIGRVEGNEPEVLAWNEGSYVFEKPLSRSNLTMYIQIPIKNTQERIFKDILDQTQMIFLFALLAAALSFIINRYLGKTLSQLAETTTGLPAKLKERETINWPDSSVLEVDSLITNFKSMSTNLSTMLYESFELNRKLKSQAQMLQRSEERLQKLAYYDTMTGLPNRQQFQLYLSNQLKANAGNDQVIAVMFIDINQFKQINDTLGHSVGDQILKYIAEKFQLVETDNAKVFRLGGDEFVVVLKANTKGEVKKFGGEITQLFSEPLTIKDMVLYITASVGVSMYPYDGEDLDTLVKYADIAMYNSKDKGRNYIQFFDSSMKENFSKRMIMNNGLQEALEENQLELFYQPRIDTYTATISGMEALMRWTHPQLGNVSPAAFIPIAEESGLILKIDEWGLREACKQNKQWQDEGFPKIPVSVNISVKHFYQGQLVEMVKSALEESGLEPECLQLEITESLFINHKSDVIDTIIELRDLGVKVSIDDFGNGYSSLIHLLKLPIHEVKLDRDFIKDLHMNHKKGAMVKAIMEVAKSLELNVVAEGVEIEEEWKYLQQLKCDEIQGYFFSKPLSKAKFKEFLEIEQAMRQQQLATAWREES